jgi:hypothetical protein
MSSLFYDDVGDIQGCSGKGDNVGLIIGITISLCCDPSGSAFFKIMNAEDGCFTKTVE